VSAILQESDTHSGKIKATLAVQQLKKNLLIAPIQQRDPTMNESSHLKSNNSINDLVDDTQVNQI